MIATPKLILFFSFLSLFFLPQCNKSTTQNDTASTQSRFLVKRAPLVGKKAWRGIVRSANRIELRAERSVRVSKLHVKNYQSVKKGQLLLEVDRSEAESRLKQFKEELSASAFEKNAAQVRFGYAQKVVERKKPLIKKGIIPQKDFDDAERELSLAENDLKAKSLKAEKSKRDVAEAEEQQKSSNYRSPLDGVVSGLIEDPASQPEIAAGLLLAVVADPSQLALWIPVDEGSVHRLGIGTKMQVALDGASETPWIGKVLGIGSGTLGGEGSRKGASRLKTYEVSVGFNPGSAVIREGYAGSATIEFERKEDALSIPSVALRHQDGRDVVLASSSISSPTELRPVTLGIQTDNEVEIISGLSENEYVLVESN